MRKSISKIEIHKGTKGATDARKHAALILMAIRLDMRVLRKRWTRRGQLRKATDMAFRNARDASAAGFHADHTTLARVGRALAEAAT